MSKPLRAGGEVDAWCTKCKLVLNHRVIAMVGPVPARVECSTCGSHHNFRARAPGEKAEKAEKTRPTSTRASGASGGSPSLHSARGSSRAAAAAIDRAREWEKAIAGKGIRDFRPYRVSETFSEGELVKHSKFGDGVVTRILDARKVEILFKDESRMLAQGLSD
ncbi:MAG: hypothetical protein FWD73_12515 [Polyangiaceae bacterium]|nr:hypothetical protein [Polyangiaceae bacterium]